MDFKELELLSNNPSRVIATVYNRLEEAVANKGGKLNTKGDPFSFCVDLIVGTNYSFISRLGDTTAATYSVHARNLKDLSKEMSDEDWVGVFSEPSGTTVRYIIGEETLNKVAIDYTEADGNLVNVYKKLVLPPDTIFKVAGIPFLLENPVEIRVMQHGGYQVVYDSTYNSPLKPLVSNSPDKEVLRIGGVNYLSIHLPVRQLFVTEDPNIPVNITSGMKKTITHKDKLYAIRAFITPDGSATRSEMSVVYNNEVFDPNQPTLVVDIIDENNFQVSIPTVYLQNGMALGRVTILTYTTMGELNRDRSTLASQQYDIEYFDYRNTKGALDSYSAPFRGINEVRIDCIAPITGGQNAISFNDLKNTIIYGHRRRQIPISNSDLEQTLLAMGYDSAKSVDSVTRRLLRTTKDLPIQENKLFEDESMARFNSSIGTYTGSILTSMEELVASGNAIDNGKRVSILRGAVFDITEQTAKLVPAHEIVTLKGSSNQLKIDVMGNKSMVYLPFLYVIDGNNSRAEVRCYRVTNPEIMYQLFRYENANLGIQVSIGSITVVSDATGYLIEIKTKSSDAYKDLQDNLVGIQLSFKAAGSNSPAVMRGTLKGRTSDKERIWQFKLDSRFDIDSLDQIDLKGFTQFGRPQEEIRVDLDERANFIFTYAGDGLTLKSSADFKIEQSLFDRTNVAIIETEYRVIFGKPLNSLYTRIRPMVGPAQYQKYEQNVPETYEEDIYQYENKKLVIVNGQAVLLHRKGDPVKNPDGSPRWLHLAGTTVYNEKGEPVLLEPRKLKYHWDFIGFDFNYMLSQDDYDATYLGLVEDFFANEVNDQIARINAKALDETRIMFKPRSTMGYTQVILNEGISKTIRTDINLSVIYYLNDEGMSDEDLKRVLTNNTHKVANEQLRKDTFSVSELTGILRANDVMDVRIIATAGIDVVDVITNVDDTNGFSVKKVLDQTSDRLLTIKEDIEIVFKRHLVRR